MLIGAKTGAFADSLLCKVRPNRGGTPSPTVLWNVGFSKETITNSNSFGYKTLPDKGLNAPTARARIVWGRAPSPVQCRATLENFSLPERECRGCGKKIPERSSTLRRKSEREPGASGQKSRRYCFPCVQLLNTFPNLPSPVENISFTRLSLFCLRANLLHTKSWGGNV
jgi:hypothetical protein